MVLPVSRSPASSASTPSRSRASAKAGSAATRWPTRSLKLRVRVMVHLLRCISCISWGAPAPLVGGPQGLGGLDILLLAALGPAGQQDDELRPVAGEIDPVARPPVQPVLRDAVADRLAVSEKAALEAGQGHDNLGGGLCVEAGEPVGEGAGTLLVGVVAQLHRRP